LANACAFVVDITLPLRSDSDYGWASLSKASSADVGDGVVTGSFFSSGLRKEIPDLIGFGTIEEFTGFLT